GTALVFAGLVSADLAVVPAGFAVCGSLLAGTGSPTTSSGLVVFRAADCASRAAVCRTADCGARTAVFPAAGFRAGRAAGFTAAGFPAFFGSDSGDLLVAARGGVVGSSGVWRFLDITAVG